MDALNLTHSPENGNFGERADLFHQSAGETVGTQLTSVYCHPGVSDSIELHNGKQSTRRATKGSWIEEYPSMTSNLKRGVQMATSRVMGTGTPFQWLAMKRGNARRVKVPTMYQLRKKNYDRYSRSEQS